MSSLRPKSATPQPGPEHFPPLKLQTSPDLFVNMVVKSFPETNEEDGHPPTRMSGRTFFASKGLLLLKN